jgi:hypothetical protein
MKDSLKTGIFLKLQFICKYFLLKTLNETLKFQIDRIIAIKIFFFIYFYLIIWIEFLKLKFLQEFVFCFKNHAVYIVISVCY